MAKGESYEQFVEKFKPKKTTDDCYTPPEIYDTVKDYACERFGIDKDRIVRPFYPGGDYENYEYKDGDVVLDNPPFSILAQIIFFYTEHNIPFFLFAPTLTIFSFKRAVYNRLVCGAEIEYANGAKVNTSFVTSYGLPHIAESAPELLNRLNKTSELLKRKKTKKLPKYEYPEQVLTASKLAYLSYHNIDFSVDYNNAVQISALDAQREKKKVIFGRGLLLSEKAAAEKAAAEKAAAEKAAAEKAAAEKWELSARELNLIEYISKKGQV